MYPTELPYLHQGPIIRLVTIWKASLLVCKSNHLNRVYPAWTPQLDTFRVQLELLSYSPDLQQVIQEFIWTSNPFSKARSARSHPIVLVLINPAHAALSAPITHVAAPVDIFALSSPILSHVPL